MLDAVVFAKGVLLGTVASLLVILYAYRFENYSRAVFVIHAALLFLLLAGSRGSFRLFSEFVHRRQSGGERCVVYGTGGASLSTIREAFGDRVALRVAGFIDDDPKQRHLRVGGYPVLGDFETLLDMIDRRGVDCVVLNTRMIAVDRLERLEAVCQTGQIHLLRLQLHVKPFSAAS
jgi:UDP-GlcNAc:undecaprenyl-phosphate GlcNAc-1-phosphate transferase